VLNPTRVAQPARVAELFAGVGGFRIGLERSGFRVVWANQWEPATKAQHAFACYAAHFPDGQHVCEDIERVMDEAEAGRREIPEHDLLVGGFPCQDYSVAKTLNQALGIEGKKGVLWWQIHRLLTMRRPPYLFLENVDRLLKSPATQRGRDFAVMLVTLANLGYEVEWRVVNAADYGFPQKRRRVYLVGRLAEAEPRDPNEVLYGGALARALPVHPGPVLSAIETFRIDGDPAEVSDTFGSRHGETPFRSSGYFSHRRVWTLDVEPTHHGPRLTLGDILEPADAVPEPYYVPPAQLRTWQYLKGAKKEQRIHKGTGTPYFYVEGPIPFPDRTDGPSRTILTAEGGATPSRFKHLIRTEDGRFRRLTPRELERLNGFPDDWTDTGMPAGRRAFMMGNALVVGVVERIGSELAKEVQPSLRPGVVPMEAPQLVAS
jgi:DNA (cytosine-5)-methyltransferase 1